MGGGYQLLEAVVELPYSNQWNLTQILLAPLSGLNYALTELSIIDTVLTVDSRDN